MPSRGDWLVQDVDMHRNWDRCREFYGDNFNFQLFIINRKDYNVWLPPVSECKDLFVKYFENPETGYFDLFKAQWLLNDYLTVGLRFPAQACWNWRMRWWEIHPGYLRGLVYNILDVQEWQAWYQPMAGKEVPYTHKFISVDDILNHFTGYEYYEAELTNYFGKPLLNMNLYISRNANRAKEHESIFFKNIENGINIVTDDIDNFKKEIHTLPNELRDRFIFNSSIHTVTLTSERFDKDKLYSGLFFAGTNLDKFNNYERNRV